MQPDLSLSLCLHFTAIFPGGLGYGTRMSPFMYFIGAKFDGGGDDMTTGAVRRSNRHRHSINCQAFQGRMPFLSPCQQCQEY